MGNSRSLSRKLNVVNISEAVYERKREDHRKLAELKSRQKEMDDYCELVKSVHRGTVKYVESHDPMAFGVNMPGHVNIDPKDYV